MTLEELIEQVDKAHIIYEGEYCAVRETVTLCHKLMSEEVDRWIAEHGLARIEVTNAKRRIEGLKEDYRYNLKLAQSYSIELLQKDEHIKELEAELDELHKATSEFIIQKLNSGTPLSISSDKVIT